MNKPKNSSHPLKNKQNKKPPLQEAFRNVVNMWTLTLIKSFYINLLSQYKKPH